MKNTQELLKILVLEQINDKSFNGISSDIGSPNVFGGQVLAQAVHAAHKTIKNKRVLNSLHSYFLEAGSLDTSINYNVEILRDGGSFSTRRVTAFQNDKPIFVLAASFHKKEEGFNYQTPIKEEVKQPEELLSWDDILEQMGGFIPKGVKDFLEVERPVVFKPVQLINPLEKKDLPPVLDIWFKPKGKTTDLTLSAKQEILTYISDYNLLTTCLNPHASTAHFGNMQLASLDHSMWFHRDFDFSDWLLFSVEVENNSGARGLAKGKIFTRDGILIATVIQEGLMRRKNN